MSKGSARALHEVAKHERTQEMLREAEERFRSAFGYAAIGMALVGTDGRWLQVNRSLCEIVGYSEQELLSKTFQDITHPDDLEAVLGYVRQLFSGEVRTHQMEKRYFHKLGHEVWVLLSVSLERDTKGNPLYFISQIQDITERKRAEEELRAATSRLGALIENLQAGVLVEDDSRCISHANQEFCSMFGIPAPPQALIGADCSESAEEIKGLFAEPERFVGRIEELLRERRVVTGEELLLADGRVFERDYVPIFVGDDYRGHLWHYRDITERKRAEEALHQSEERFRSLVQYASDIITILEPDGTIRYESPSIERILGYRQEELVGKNAFEYVHPEDVEQTLGEFTKGLNNPTSHPSAQFRFKHADGSWRYLEAFGNNQLANPSVQGYVVNSRDITERKAFERQLQHQALHDPLTNLANRTLLMDRLEHALTRGSRGESNVAVLFMDLDNFKVINDSLGHEAGDQLLTEVAGRLQACLRPGDTIARLSGDEFAVLLEDIRGVNDATEIAERIAEELRAPVDLEAREVVVTTSIGIAFRSSAQDKSSDLLRNADLALYRAKDKGKAHYELFDPSMNIQVLERLELSNDLRRAIERGELSVCYQPKVLLDGNLQNHLRVSGSPAIVAPTTPRAAQEKIIGMEALVRWEHPEIGLLRPSEFIPIAEETGLIIPIGRWVLNEACSQARAWQEQHPSDPPLAMCVNLSARQFQHSNLAKEVAGVLRSAGLEPRYLELEITESVLMEDGETTIRALQELKDLGVRLAIDDFGTGYSSLSYLKRFPIDFLKIDRSFVERLRRDPEDAMIVSGIITLAHTLGMQVIAEGVESTEQLAQLRGLGCDLAQGNYFSEPLPAEAASALLATDPHWYRDGGR